MKNADDRNRTADLCFLRDHFTDSATTIAQVALVCTETTVNSDRPSIHYPPIPDLFVNKEYFSTLHKWFNFDIIEK